MTLLAASLASVAFAQQAANAPGTLQRRYQSGEVSHYVMTGDNDGWKYTIHASEVVKQDADGKYFEEISWSNLTSNAQQSLTPASLALRQTVSLDDPAAYMRVPDLSKVQPLLIGPITDTLTIYSDLLLAISAKLSQIGATSYVSRVTPNSWADGQRVLVGEDVVDFNLKVESVDAQAHTEILLVRHVPPTALHVQLPAPWMQAAPPAAPTNFVQVTKEVEGFTAEAGMETFDVRIVVDTRDGAILSASLHNPVVLTARECSDRELTKCGPSTTKTTLREITWKRVS